MWKGRHGTPQARTAGPAVCWPNASALELGIPSWAAYTVCVHTILGGVEAVGPANTEHV